MFSNLEACLEHVELTHDVYRKIIIIVSRYPGCKKNLSQMHIIISILLAQLQREIKLLKHCTF